MSPYLRTSLPLKKAKEGNLSCSTCCMMDFLHAVAKRGALHCRLDNIEHPAASLGCSAIDESAASHRIGYSQASWLWSSFDVNFLIAAPARQDICGAPSDARIRVPEWNMGLSSPVSQYMSDICHKCRVLGRWRVPEWTHARMCSIHRVRT